MLIVKCMRCGGDAMIENANAFCQTCGFSWVVYEREKLDLEEVLRDVDVDAESLDEVRRKYEDPTYRPGPGDRKDVELLLKTIDLLTQAVEKLENATRTLSERETNATPGR